MIITYVTVNYNNKFHSFDQKQNDITVLLVFFLLNQLLNFI